MFTLWQISNPVLRDDVQALQGAEYFNSILPNIVLIGLIIGTTVFFFIFMIGAIQWITAGGNKQAIEAARNKITQGLIGLFVLLLIFLIVQLFNYIFGTNIGMIGGPPGGGGRRGTCVCVNNRPIGGQNRCLPPAVARCDGDNCTCEYPNCGDGVIEGNEECDGSIPAGITCETILGPGYSGTLVCTGSCTIDTSGCGLQSGASCTRNRECSSNYCASMIDADGDTFFIRKQQGAQGECHPRQPVDCNDEQANVNPHITRYFPRPIARGPNQGTFDYNCSERDEVFPGYNCVSDNNDLIPWCRDTLPSYVEVQPHLGLVDHQSPGGPPISSMPACGEPVPRYFVKCGGHAEGGRCSQWQAHSSYGPMDCREGCWAEYGSTPLVGWNLYPWGVNQANWPNVYNTGISCH